MPWCVILVPLYIYLVMYTNARAEREDRPHHRYQQRGLRGQGLRAERARKVFVGCCDCWMNSRLDARLDARIGVQVLYIWPACGLWPRFPSLFLHSLGRKLIKNMYCLLCYNQSISFVLEDHPLVVVVLLCILCSLIDDSSALKFQTLWTC